MIEQKTEQKPADHKAIREALEASEREWRVSCFVVGSDLRALLADLDEARAALSAAKAGGWKPIETAPRGSGIDGPNSVSHPDYVRPPKVLLWTEDGPLVGYYDWYYHPGYGRGAEDGESVWRDHSGARTYGATHWQPLPNPPKEQA